jgi:hypothetical protein
MVATDALNGWWVARMVGSSGALGARASRVMSLTVALLCFAIAALGLAKFELPSFVGIGTLAIVLAAWLVARHKSLRQPVSP